MELKRWLVDFIIGLLKSQVKQIFIIVKKFHSSWVYKISTKIPLAHILSLNSHLVFLNWLFCSQTLKILIPGQVCSLFSFNCGECTCPESASSPLALQCPSHSTIHFHSLSHYILESPISFLALTFLISTCILDILAFPPKYPSNSPVRSLGQSKPTERMSAPW